ncbi:hypothetical protein Taro_013029, partial [Colocasia esculenta]|nr:hypothetical protein [Colocasia esculenta]
FTAFLTMKLVALVVPRVTECHAVPFPYLPSSIPAVPFRRPFPVEIAPLDGSPGEADSAPAVVAASVSALVVFFLRVPADPLLQRQVSAAVRQPRGRRRVPTECYRLLGIAHCATSNSHCRCNRLSTDWDKAWSNFKKQGKKSLFSGFNPNKYVTWNPKRSEYPLSEEIDPIKRTERSNLVLWTSPKFTLVGAIILVTMLLLYTLLAPMK